MQKREGSAWYIALVVLKQVGPFLSLPIPMWQSMINIGPSITSRGSSSSQVMGKITDTKKVWRRLDPRCESAEAFFDGANNFKTHLQNLQNRQNLCPDEPSVIIFDSYFSFINRNTGKSIRAVSVEVELAPHSKIRSYVGPSTTTWNMIHGQICVNRRLRLRSSFH